LLLLFLEAFGVANGHCINAKSTEMWKIEKYV